MLDKSSSESILALKESEESGEAEEDELLEIAELEDADLVLAIEESGSRAVESISIYSRPRVLPAISGLGPGVFEEEEEEEEELLGTSGI